MSCGPLNRAATRQHLKARGLQCSEDALDLLEGHIVAVLERSAEVNNPPTGRVTRPTMWRSIHEVGDDGVK